MPLFNLIQDALIVKIRLPDHSLEIKQLTQRLGRSGTVAKVFSLIFVFKRICSILALSTNPYLNHGNIIFKGLCVQAQSKQ